MSGFTFNGTSAATYGLVVTNKSVYAAPKKDMQELTVPGRSGNLLIDNKRFENASILYECVTIPVESYTTIAERVRAIKGWLLGSTGYKSLTDNYITGYTRYGYYAGAMDIDEIALQVGKVPIAFSCKPFLYLDAGLATTTMTTPGNITNPEAFASKPYIKITGSGDVTLSIGASSFVFSSIGPSIEIDSEIMNVFRGATSLNYKMTASGFPELAPGVNAISWTGTVTKVEIIPRWCTI